MDRILVTGRHAAAPGIGVDSKPAEAAATGCLGFSSYHKMLQATLHMAHKVQLQAYTLGMLWLQALEFEAGQRNWLLQQDALHAAAEMRLRQEVAASQAAVEAHRTNQLADWAAQEQEDTLRLHQVTPAC